MTWVHVLYLLNGLWFLAAFAQFSLAQGNTAKILVPYGARDNALVPTVKASVAFLGLMNFALALLALYLATGPSLFGESGHFAVLMAFFAVANGGQFVGNLPVLKQRKQAGSLLWPVLTGPMLMIFAIDATLAIADAAAAAYFFSL